MKKVLAVILFCALSSVASAAPSIEFSGMKADLGTYSAGEKVEHAFEFRNSGDEELIIQNISTS